MLDLSKQVFIRSARMGLSYIILSLLMGTFLTVGLNFGTRAGNVVAGNGNLVQVGDILSVLVVPSGALVGLVITTPVYLLFVSDKNSGVLEYLLAVGMGQRDIFLGYLKAALYLSLLAMVPVVIINTAFAYGGVASALFGGALALGTGLADVALVTVLMTAFSSMQRRPTGMNSPIGISIGVGILMPEFLLISVLGKGVFWVEVGLAMGVTVASVASLALVGKLINREKLLP